MNQFIYTIIKELYLIFIFNVMQRNKQARNIINIKLQTLSIIQNKKNNKKQKEKNHI